jgi:iron complex outermembrane receptor protein
VDGSARHRGLEGSLAQHFGAWSLQGSAMLLDAQRQGSAQPGINGQRPVNVPKATLRLGGELRPAAAPGLALQAGLVAESNRVVLPYDTSVQIPGWTRLDLGARYRHTLGASTLTWRVGVDNATDRKAWKESPYQFGHAYLYPINPRSWRASVQADF